MVVDLAYIIKFLLIDDPNNLEYWFGFSIIIRKSLYLLFILGCSFYLIGCFQKYRRSWVFIWSFIGFAGFTLGYQLLLIGNDVYLFGFVLYNFHQNILWLILMILFMGAMNIAAGIHVWAIAVTPSKKTIEESQITDPEIFQENF
jgi:hypothetical protein